MVNAVDGELVKWRQNRAESQSGVSTASCLTYNQYNIHLVTHNAHVTAIK